MPTRMICYVCIYIICKRKENKRVQRERVSETDGVVRGYYVQKKTEIDRERKRDIEKKEYV